MKKNPLLGKHSHNNRESKLGEVLRYIREAKKLSQKDVAQKLNLKALDIDHFENGRKFYTQEDVDTFLKCYEINHENFKILIDLKILNRQLVNHFLRTLNNL